MLTRSDLDALIPGHSFDPRLYLPRQDLAAPQSPVLRRDDLGLAFTPVRPDHYPFLFALSLSGRNSFRWRYRNQIPSFETFCQQMHADSLTHFMLQVEATEVGYVVAYNIDFRSRYAYIGLVMVEAAQGAGFGVASVWLMAEYLRATFNIRKVILEVPEFSFRDLAAGGGRFDGFDVEGVLTEYVYLDGRYWDMVILSATLGD